MTARTDASKTDTDKTDTGKTDTSKNGTTTPAQWRQRPGFVARGGSDAESIHILLGYFLKDRHSPDPLPAELVGNDPQAWAWGTAPPLEKVIRSRSDLNALLCQPPLVRHSIAIVEPWEHVGCNDRGEPVRASLNVAALAQAIADADSVLYPIWDSGTFDPEALAAAMSGGLAIVVEGGDPSAYDPDSFAGTNCTREEMLALTEQILLSRAPTSAPAIFICLGHQLACMGHIRLLQRAVTEVGERERLERDVDGNTLRALQRVCRQIQIEGERLDVRKGDRIVAKGWHDPLFGVARNECREVGGKRLQHYCCPDFDGHVPYELVQAHEVTADEFEGIIDTMLEYERDVHISMFHGDEANEEAVLFANWAYRLLHDAIVPHRHVLAGSTLSWLLQLPYAVEILCSTAIADTIVTEVSATCITYKDFETKQVRRSFTVQFHPELLDDLRDFSHRPLASYADLKHDDGIRLFARLLYVAMQE